LLACKQKPQATDSGVLLEEEITPAVVMCGMSHSAAITRRGVLYTFGSNIDGQLGAKEPAVDASAVPLRTIINPKPQHRIVSVAVRLFGWWWWSSVLCGCYLAML
jgi:alpha-tubulin suppressor-like RCC1 family protein